MFQAAVMRAGATISSTAVAPASATASRPSRNGKKASDAIAQPVTWHGHADLSALRGKAVYLRFKLKRATLYTFQIAP